MSMMGHYARISLKELNELKSHPDSIINFLEAIENDEPNDRSLDIKKAWHQPILLGTSRGSIFSRSEQPLWNALMGGTPLGSIEFGYGPVRFLAPRQVKETAKALKEVSEAEFRNRFDLQKFNENKIYPPPAPNELPENGELFPDYLVNHYLQLVNFFQTAAKHGDAILIYVT